MISNHDRVSDREMVRELFIQKSLDYLKFSWLFVHQGAPAGRGRRNPRLVRVQRIPRRVHRRGSDASLPANRYFIWLGVFFVQHFHDDILVSSTLSDCIFYFFAVLYSLNLAKEIVDRIFHVF